MIMLAAIKKDGKVYTGRRHDIILNEAETKHGLGFGGLKNAEQGFVTSNNVFVDRFAAAQIAFSFGQIKKLPASLRLYSEDLDFLMVLPKQLPEIQIIINQLKLLRTTAQKNQEEYELGNVNYHYQLGVRTGLNRAITLLEENVPKKNMLLRWWEKLVG